MEIGLDNRGADAHTENTDHNITGSEGLAAQARTIVEGALARFSDQIARVENPYDSRGAAARETVSGIERTDTPRARATSA